MADPTPTPPKRGRGRPRKEKSPDRGAGGQFKAQPKYSEAKLRSILEGLIVAADAGATALSNFTRSRFWEQGAPPLGDQLVAQEVQILSASGAAELTKHPRALRVVDRLYRVAGSAGLAGAIVIVAIPRLERRSLIPHGISRFIAKMLEEMQTTATDDAGNRTEVPTAETPPDREAESAAE